MTTKKIRKKTAGSAKEYPTERSDVLVLRRLPVLIEASSPAEAQWAVHTSGRMYRPFSLLRKTCQHLCLNCFRSFFRCQGTGHYSL